MNIIIELGKKDDIDELEDLYNNLNDYLAEGINYPGWIKGIYPIREDASKGVDDKNLYVAKCGGRIAGSIILNHQPEKAYYDAEWAIDSDYENIMVIHTFVVNPQFMRCGVGKSLMQFAQQHSVWSKAKSIRLDVYEKNTPAINLYEKCGFKYINTVDLGLGQHGLDAFKLYEKLI